MAQPVWVLSVDLQTKTATFQSGMADAAKAARGSFTEIKEGAGSMASETGYKMTEARHGVMLLGEEFGIHLPRALTSFIASLGPIGAAMEAAFPFLAIVVGATLLLEHLSKLKEEGEKLTESQIQFGTTVANVLTGLDNKLLEAGIRTDELNHNHLGALNKQLELIDHQSMNELVRAFETVAKAADLSFAQLKTSWYQFGAGSAGAKHALEQFKTEYDSLLARGKDKEANDLLSGTLQSAEKILALQKQAADNVTQSSRGGHKGNYNQFEEAKLALQKQGIGYTDKEVTAQQMLVEALRAQEEVQGKVTALKAMQSDNARQSTQVAVDKDSDSGAKQQADVARKAQEEADKLWQENYRRAVSALQENEREKIDATEKGSAERLQAIDAAIKEENSKGLQETGFYKSMLQARVQLIREIGTEESKQKAEAGRIDADQTLKMGELSLQAKRQASQLEMSAHSVSAAAKAALDRQYADEDFKLKQDELNGKIAALDKADKDYENKLRQFQNKQLQLIKEHENQVTQIKNRAEEDRNSRILSAETRMADTVASTTARSIVQARSLGAAFQQMGASMLESAIRNALELETVQGRQRLSDARTAASRGYEWGWKHGGVAAPVLAPALGALAFASALAFEKGGLVPGVGNGDVVPARLTPGETVIPKAMTEKLSKAADSGSDNRPHVQMHVHHSPTIHALDSQGMERALEKNAETLNRHLQRELRRMNR